MKTFRYVPWNRLADYERLGWLAVADLGGYHRQFSVLCERRCGCRCDEPLSQQTQRSVPPAAASGRRNGFGGTI